MFIINWLNESQEEKEKAVVQFQRFRSSTIDILARMAAFFCEEEFYLILFPILLWGPYCDAKLGYNFCVCIGLGLPLGNFLKNIFCVRRPHSPHVWQYYTSNEEHEFALPSTHALLSASLSIHTALHHVSNYDHHQSVLFILAWFVFVVVYTLGISLSRVYMGAHYFQDIVIGGVIGMAFGLILSISLELLHEPLVTGSYWVILCFLGLLLVMLHAHPTDKSSRLNFHLSEGTFDYSPALLGMALGGVLSRTWYIPVQEQCIPSWNFSLLIRYVIGTPVSIAAYISIKKMLPFIIEPIMKSLKIKAHYNSHSEYSKYLSQEIKFITKPQDVAAIGGDVATAAAGEEHEANGNTSGKTQNPEYLIAWVRIYTKLLLYAGLTYVIAVFVPLVTGLFLNDMK